MENNKGKSFIIGALVIAVMVMAVGYAALAANLQINGTANITSTWNVAITNIVRTDTSPSGGGVDRSGSPTHDATTATFNVDFTTPGQYAEYDITVSNTGSIPAVLSSITGPTVSVGTIDEALGIKFTVTGVTANVTKLPATSGTNTVHVKVEWDSAATTVPTNTTKTLTMTLNYAQDFSS